jgi:PilZ domain
VSEQRRHFRKPVDYAIEFSHDQGVRSPGICRDFSLGGMAIEATHAAPFGAKVTVYLQLAGIQGVSALPGVVRWTKGNTMGVQFGLLGARETYAITEMLTGS